MRSSCTLGNGRRGNAPFFAWVQTIDTLAQLDGWTGDALRQRLPEGWQITLLASVESTQDVAKAAARAGAPPGSTFVADHQTVGRGRQGRVWVAPPGTSLMLSTLLHGVAGERPQQATLIAAVALAEAVERLVPRLDARVKWPNDLMLEGRKAAGILTEGSWLGGRATLIVGMGVNVHTTAAQLAELGGRATSLDVASGGLVNRGELLLELLDGVDRWRRAPWENLRQAWEQRLWGVGQVLRLQEPTLDGAQDVVVLGVEDDGALRVRLQDGREIRSLTAEILL